MINWIVGSNEMALPMPLPFQVKKIGILYKKFLQDHPAEMMH